MVIGINEADYIMQLGAGWSQFEGLGLKIYIDGGVKDHHLREGRAGYIAIVTYRELVEPVEAYTNNEAEYLALERALKLAIDQKESEVKVLSDSELLVNQMKGKYKVRKKNLQALKKKVDVLKVNFRTFGIEWISRKENLAGRLLERTTKNPR